jgi:transposase-like protein
MLIDETPFLVFNSGQRTENEALDYIQFHKDRLDENGQRLVVRNGHLPEREVISGAGRIPVRQPRVRHRDQGRFSSAILPKYMRRAPSVDALIPALYLKGISTRRRANLCAGLDRSHRRWQQRIVSGGRRLSRKHPILA